MKSALGSMFDDLQDRYNEPEHPDYTTGFEELDALTAGFHDEDLIVVGGRPSAGKTTFVLALCQHVALRRMQAVAFFDLESSAKKLATKIVSSLSGVDTHALRSGLIEDEDWSRVTSAIRLLQEATFWIDDSAGMTPDALRNKILQLRKEKELSLAVIDSLQMMRAPWLRNNRAAEVSEIVRSLKELAKEIRTPVIAVSQLARPTERSYPLSRPVLTDFRDSGAIEETADLAILLHQTAQTPNIIEVILAKQKNGPEGSFQLRFDREISRMTPLHATLGKQAEPPP